MHDWLPENERERVEAGEGDLVSPFLLNSAPFATTSLFPLINTNGNRSEIAAV